MKYKHEFNGPDSDINNMLLFSKQLYKAVKNDNKEKKCSNL